MDSTMDVIELLPIKKYTENLSFEVEVIILSQTLLMKIKKL